VYFLISIFSCGRSDLSIILSNFATFDLWRPLELTFVFLPPSLPPSLLLFQGPTWNVLDAGCGTGLSGVLFRNLSSHLMGVDVSRRMVQRAEARGVYDELSVGDMAEELLARAGSLDLVSVLARAPSFLRPSLSFFLCRAL